MTARKVDRTLGAIVGAVVLVVIVALVLVFTRGAPETLDADSPEGVVQRYSAAVIDGDETEALGYLLSDLADGCMRNPAPFQESTRVTLVSTTVREESADVRVSISMSYDSDPFGGESTSSETFDLEREDGDWRIASAPWQLTICTGSKFEP